MDAEFLVPLGFFAMVAYIVKLISDNRLRRKVLNSPASEEMAEALLKQQQWSGPRTRSALKWGLVFVALGVGVLFVQMFAIGFESPLAYAILLLATGAALLGYYAVEHDAKPAEPVQAASESRASAVADDGPSAEPAESVTDPVQDPER